jgi:hypothetical protein
MIGRDALVVDAVLREVIVRVATDVGMPERVRRVVRRESLRLRSVAGLVEVVVTLRLLLRMDRAGDFPLREYLCYYSPPA